VIQDIGSFVEIKGKLEIHNDIDLIVPMNMSLIDDSNT